MYQYIVKVLNDSDLLRYFEDFREKCVANSVTTEDFKILKDHYINFILAETPINGAVEVRRIFPKVLNIYSSMNNIRGTESGRLSRYPYTFDDLRYNDINSRDIGRDRRLTRQESALASAAIHRKEELKQYEIERQMNLLRRIQPISEVHDKLEKGPATQVHHIFPKADFPEIAASLENLIKLTPSQHYGGAHPQNDTHSINHIYQITCLLSKSRTIEDSLNRGEDYYSKENFIHVINTGYSLKWPDNLSFYEINAKLRSLFSKI